MILLFSEKLWHMIKVVNPLRVLALVPDYKVNLIAPASIEDADESFRHLGREEVEMLNACVGAKIAVKEGEEAIDVCLAIQQMNEEAAQKAAKKEFLHCLLTLRTLWKKWDGLRNNLWMC